LQRFGSNASSSSISEDSVIDGIPVINSPSTGHHHATRYSTPPTGNYLSQQEAQEAFMKGKPNIGTDLERFAPNQNVLIPRKRRVGQGYAPEMEPQSRKKQKLFTAPKRSARATRPPQRFDPAQYDARGNPFYGQTEPGPSSQIPIEPTETTTLRRGARERRPPQRYNPGTEDKPLKKTKRKSESKNPRPKRTRKTPDKYDPADYTAKGGKRRG
jgi:hypothetical protein